MFSYIYYVHVPKSDRSKLDSKALMFIFLRYAWYQKDYKCHHPTTQNHIVSIDFTFHETNSFFSPY